MILSKYKKASLFLVLLASLTLSACGGSSSSEPLSQAPTSDVEATLTLEDLVIKVNDTVPLNPIFNPSSAATAITYEIEDENIVAISRSGILSGLAVGETNVTATSQNNLSDTFNVVVEESDEVPLTTLEQFNVYGEFEEVTVPGWRMTGTTAEAHIPEVDVDREQEDMSLKLWAGDYDAEDETASVIDFTLTLTYDGIFTAGDYTLSFDVVGVVNDISVTLEGVTYTKSAGDISISGGDYRSNYFEFTLSSDKALDLAFVFYSPGTQTNWGFLDSVKMNEGHIKPDIPEEPDDGNYLADGSFEIAGSQAEWLDASTNEFLAWQIEGTLRSEESVTLDTAWPRDRDVSLKYNYWPTTTNTERPIGDVKVFQTFTLDTQATFDLKYYVAGGGISDSDIYILVDGTEVYRSLIPNHDPYSLIELNDILIDAGEIEFGIHIQEDAQTWIHLDYMLLTLAE